MVRYLSVCAARRVVVTMFAWPTQRGVVRLIGEIAFKHTL